MAADAKKRMIVWFALNQLAMAKVPLTEMQISTTVLYGFRLHTEDIKILLSDDYLSRF